MKRIINLIKPKLILGSPEWIQEQLSFKAELLESFSCVFCNHPKQQGHLCSNCDYESPQYQLKSIPTIHEEIDE
jgi:hypothetical protein